LITFTHESWDELARDAAVEIFPRHWRELALDRNEIPLSVDVELYSNSDKKGVLHVVVARNDGFVVGYIFFWIMPHPHYKDFGLQASTDAFYVLPEFRKGGLGARMLMFAEESLRERGIKKLAISTKVHENHADVLKALGFKVTDIALSKLL
jgi:GNAT superfamily N-acetyltransferase